MPECCVAGSGGMSSNVTSRYIGEWGEVRMAIFSAAYFLSDPYSPGG